MLKIEVYGKEFKEAVEKALTVVPKKSSIHVLERMLIETTEKGIKIIVTDMDQWLEITLDAVILEQGKILLDSNDIKLLLKMTEYITITELDSGKIDIKTSKKNLSMNTYDVKQYPDIPKADEIEALQIKENCLLEAVVNLSAFTSQSDNNKMFQIYNFNLKNKRIEVLDGHRLGIKSIEKETILNDSQEIHLSIMACPVFKKLLDKKSEANIILCYSENYTIVKGTGFKYIQRRVEGNYFDINGMLTSNYDHRMVVDCKELLEVTKYNCDLRKIGKSEKVPMFFYSTGNDIATYFNNGKIESVDRLTTKSAEVKKDFFIAVNPEFIKDAMNIIDSETALCTMTNAKAPIMIYGKEYSFLILPVNSTQHSEIVNNMKEYLQKIGVITEVA